MEEQKIKIAFLGLRGIPAHYGGYETFVEETGELAWHGYITHVPSGQRRYLREIDDVVAFIRSCLETGSARLSGS